MRARNNARYCTVQHQSVATSTKHKSSHPPCVLYCTVHTVLYILYVSAPSTTPIVPIPRIAKSKYKYVFLSRRKEEEKEPHRMEGRGGHDSHGQCNATGRGTRHSRFGIQALLLSSLCKFKHRYSYAKGLRCQTTISQR